MNHEGHVLAPVVYCDERPYDEMMPIKEPVAFYPDKFEISAS